MKKMEKCRELIELNTNEYEDLFLTRRSSAAYLNKISLLVHPLTFLLFIIIKNVLESHSCLVSSCKVIHNLFIINW